MFSYGGVNAQPALSKRAMVLAVLAHTDRTVVKVEKKLRNTLDYVDAKGVRRVRLYQTDILTIYPSGRLVIDTGGWNTHTTRDRLNAYLPSPWRVHTERGVLHFRNYETQQAWPIKSRVEVDTKGRVRPDFKPASVAKLQKQIDAYMKAWRVRGLPTAEESGGDPWIISPGKVDASIMLDWIKSKYVHRRLYGMALRYAGLHDAGIAHWYAMIDRNAGKLDKTDLRRIRRYVRACVGLES